MCGIAGKINFNQNNIVGSQEIQKMIDELHHRGPDDEGVFVDQNIGLGHKRLSILDLSEKGRQPMSDSSNEVWIVFNGEIYNFQELKRELTVDGVNFKSNTDTETIIYLYKKYGTNCLRYLRGMFAFAIWDKNKRELFIARDRVGKKPLKYYIDSNTFMFASELKAILTNKKIKKEPDYKAIDQFLTHGYIFAPKTGFKGILKLLPAHFAIIKSNGEMKTEKYWENDYSSKNNFTEKEWIWELDKKLSEATKMRMISDVPLGAMLSGGIDSSLVVALMAKQSRNRIKTFSIGFKDKDYDERHYAKLVAKKYKTEHHEFELSPSSIEEFIPKLVYQYEEPYGDSSAIPTWLLSEQVKKYVTVAINGDGGDENFAGYHRYQAIRLIEKLKFLPFKKQLAELNKILYKNTKKKIFQKMSRLLNSTGNNLPETFLNIVSLLEFDKKNSLYNEKFKFNSKKENDIIFKLFDEAKDFEMLDRQLYVGFKSHLPNDLLVKADIATMANSLEARSPMLDHEFIELSSKIPSGLKLKGQNKKYILKKLAEKYIPHECIYRPKQGFSVPLEHWFRGDLYSYIDSELLNKKFLDFGFNETTIKDLIKKHVNHSEDNSQTLWSLLYLKNWLEFWF